MANAETSMIRATQILSPNIYADVADKEAHEVIALFEAGDDVKKIKQLAKSLYVGLDTYPPGRMFGLQVIDYLCKIAEEAGHRKNQLSS